METLADVLRSTKIAPISGPAHRPQSIAEVGVRQAVLEDLALKTLYVSGPFSVFALAEHTRLSFEVANELFVRMRAEQLCQVTGMSSNIPLIAITSQGRARALELLSHNQYVGAAPVSLESYVEQVRKQSVRSVATHQADVERAFSHMVIDSKTMAQLGTALNSGTSIFLYGPTGVGKSAIAETLSRVLAETDAWIPYAIEIYGQIITVYDPVIHKRVAEPEFENGDDRWVCCHRP